MLSLQQLEASLSLDGLHDEPPGLLLDVNELSNVLVFEAGPCKIQADEAVPKLRSRGSVGHPRLLGGLIPALKHSAELCPAALQSLCAPHCLCAELELVSIDPYHGILLDTGLQHVHAVVAGLIRKKSPVVDCESHPVRAGRGVEPQCSGRSIEALQEQGAGIETSLAFRVDPATIHQQPPISRAQATHCYLLSRAEGVRVLAQQFPQHAPSHSE
mmetsp:Transcript_2070/g.4050  ORF Transcript_2070/g.4050 Transcript_2070/m.4050 type:complete len:215 (-) Transcript_2070:132-776(-)